MFKRHMQAKLRYFSGKLPVVALLGPRQSGKTTLAKLTFPDYGYISFEDLDVREFALSDPRRFLRENEHDKGLILDEIQHVPDLLSYMQTYVDNKKKNGYFIVTGSQNFLLSEAISQTLAGRIAVLTLLPLSLEELKENNLLFPDYNKVIYYGGYPRIYEQGLLPEEWISQYIFNYVERDVRQVLNVVDISVFQRFLKLCAGRIGQLLNIASLATDCGISQPTAKKWLSVLESSYIIFLLQPYFKNFSKRVIQSPKLFFYDTALACNLLEIKSEKTLYSHYLRGGLFEAMILSELYKHYYNQGVRPSIYFWRDSHGREIDAILDLGTKLIPIEMKAGETIGSDYFEGLAYWHDLTGTSLDESFVVYGGPENQARSKGTIISWQHIPQIFNKIS